MTLALRILPVLCVALPGLVYARVVLERLAAVLAG